MTNASKPGLPLTSEVSLKVDWKTLTANLVNMTTKGFKAWIAGDIVSIGDAVVSLVGAAKSIREDIPLGARGLELVILCFAWAFDSLRAADCLNVEGAKKAAKDAIAKLKIRCEDGSLEIPYDFFEKPSMAVPYEVLRDAFLIERQAYRASAGENEAEIKARFDAAFNEAVFAVEVEHAPIFEDLAKALHSPAAKAADFERQWKAYRQTLISEFQVRPVFGQEETRISLMQLYVPLRCFWREVEGDDDPTALYVEEHQERRQQTLHVCSLPNELDAWLDNSNSDDWLRLLGGGPGSGKSTSAKAFAARIAKRANLRPLFVPLQRIRVDGRLRENINNYFRGWSGCPFRVGPLDRNYVEGGPRLVLIFDGLDEIARPGSSANDIARDMIDWIGDLYSELRGETTEQHRVLVTGRMPSFQAARRRIGRRAKEALEVWGFLPIDAKKMLNERFAVNLEGDDALIQADSREQWWDLYSSALNLPKALPAAFNDVRLESLTAEPLLCYLLALSGYLDETAEEAAENHNLIYLRVLEDVYRRQWGGGRTGSGKDLSKDDFDRLLETMALAAWHGGDERVATQERFDNALKVTGATEVYKCFRERQRQEKSDLSNLAVNFYLKKPEQGARGFEFTHKSFGEYLTARATIRAASKVARLCDDSVDAALRSWLFAVEDGDLSYELLGFVEDEMRLLPLETAKSLLRSLETVMSHVVAEGFPAHRLPCETWRQAEERQRKAETMLMAITYCAAQRLAMDNKEEGRVRIDWREDRCALLRLLQRVRKGEPRSAAAAVAVFGFLESPSANLSGADLVGANFSHANLESASLFGSLLEYSNLEQANLERARLNFAYMRCASLIGANLSQARMGYSILFRAKLNDAVLCGADLERADLSGAVLAGADLRDAVLMKANCDSADFTGANLEGAILEDANVQGANFTGAIGARLNRTQGKPRVTPGNA